MKAWQKMLVVGIAVSILVVGGTIAYINYFAKRRLIVSTTTSLFETGLLNETERIFEAKYAIDVQFISAGTGIAIEHARNGDADLILVHSPSQEKTFLQEGYGVSRKIIAYNYFTIVGPQSDPAQINGQNATEALKRIADYGRNHTSEPTFKIWFSRGDNSGTHSKEQNLWKLAGFNYTTLSAESWYAGGGGTMSETLLKTQDKSAYTLADIGTYMQLKEKTQVIALSSFLQESYDLLNVYAAVLVNQTRHSHVNFEDAMTFLKFLLSDECQQLIEDFGEPDLGQSGRLFHAAVELVAGNFTTEIAQWIRKYAMDPFGGTECQPEYRDLRHLELYS